MILAHISLLFGMVSFVCYFLCDFEEDKRNLFRVSVFNMLAAIYIAVSHVAEQLA